MSAAFPRVPSMLLTAAVFFIAPLGFTRAAVLFSSLPRTLLVSATLASPPCLPGMFCGHPSAFPELSSPEAVTFPPPDLRPGLHQLRISWSFNASFRHGADDAFYAVVKLKLCFASESQIGRDWRQTEDDLFKDKTCPFDVASQPYDAAGNTTLWTVSQVVPTATYFVRAYAMDQDGNEVAYGQTTQDNTEGNLFRVESISGRVLAMDIAAVVLSIFSICAPFVFLALEKMKNNSCTKEASSSSSSSGRCTSTIPLLFNPYSTEIE